MEDNKWVSTSTVTSCKLSMDDISNDVDQRMYSSMIRSLLYMTSSRPDVMQGVGKVVHFQATPKESHVVSVKRIFRYLKGTSYFFLWYPKGNDLTITTYMNANLAGIVDDHKSTNGTTFYLGGYLVSWLNKKKSSFSFSTIEEEYIAETTCCTQPFGWNKHCRISKWSMMSPLWCYVTTPVP